MKRTSRLRLGRIGIVAVLAIVLGSLVPALTTTGSAVAASDGYMVYPASGNIQRRSETAASATIARTTASTSPGTAGHRSWRRTTV